MKTLLHTPKIALLGRYYYFPHFSNQDSEMWGD
jgi:hypothetical protein